MKHRALIFLTALLVGFLSPLQRVMAETATVAVIKIDDIHYQVNIQNYNRPFRFVVMNGLSIENIDLIDSDGGSKNIQTVVTLPIYIVHPEFKMLDYDTGKELFGITK
jgi:hypothetical protein